MNFRQFQVPIWFTLDHTTAQLWWLVNIETNIWNYDYCVVAFDVVIDIFVPTSAHCSLILDKVVFPNMLKCQTWIYSYIDYQAINYDNQKPISYLGVHIQKAFFYNLATYDNGFGSSN